MIIKSNHEIPLNCDGSVIVFEENYGKNYFIKTDLDEKFDEMELKIMFLGIQVKYILMYLLIVNLVGFFVMWWDKRQARLGNWRTPEKTLFTITFLGGGFGTIAGMYKFRHKTKKLRFTIGFPTILIGEICLIVYWIVKGEEMIGRAIGR